MSIKNFKNAAEFSAHTQALMESLNDSYKIVEKALKEGKSVSVSTDSDGMCITEVKESGK